MKKLFVTYDEYYIYYKGNDRRKAISIMINEWFDGSDNVKVSRMGTKKIKRLKKVLTTYE